MSDWLNRKEIPLPKKKGFIEIKWPGMDGEHVYLCSWRPYDPKDYEGLLKPTEGYLGTATVVEGSHPGIGYNAWEQNDHEFLYYRLVNVD